MSGGTVEPTWLAAKIDQRLALMKEKGALDIARESGTNFVMTPLTEPDEGASKAEFEAWDRTCDNCGAYCPYPTDFYTGNSVRHEGVVQIVFTFGVCATCKELK